mgnify:CR=1 FL=1
MLLLAHQLGHKATGAAAAAISGTPSKKDDRGWFSVRWRTIGKVGSFLLSLWR